MTGPTRRNMTETQLPYLPPMLPRHRLLAGLVATALVVAAAAQALARPIPPPPPSPPGTQLFVSPCGKPFRAPPGQPYPVEAWFAAADANHDGKVDIAELRADADGFFKQLDEDHDGVVDGFEITDYEHQILPEMLMNQTYGALAGPSLLARAQYSNLPSMDGPPVVDSDDLQDKTKKKPLVALQGAAPYNFLREPEPVAASDGDFNHRITLQEWEAASNRRFKLLDKDGDGALTLATLPRTAWQIEHSGR